MIFPKVAKASLAALILATTGCFAAQPGPVAQAPPELGPDYQKASGMPEGMGQLRIAIKWPGRTTQGIPLSARKLKFRIKKGAALEAAREVDQNTTTTEFNLRAGAYDLEVGAHPGTVDGTDYSETEIAGATTSVIILSSVVTNAGLALEPRFEPQLGTFDPDALLAGGNTTISGSSNLTLGWAPSLPVVTFPTGGGTGTVNATVAIVGGSLTFTTPINADTSGSFTITQDGVTKSFPYSQGASIVSLAKNLTFSVAATTNGRTYTSPTAQGGTSCTFKASGTWQDCGGTLFGIPICPPRSPEGNTGLHDSANPAGLSVANTALIIKQGSGAWQLMGKGPRTFQAASGQVFTFMANDWNRGNNEGALTVTYTCDWSKTGSVTAVAGSSSGVSFQAPQQNDFAIQFTVLGNQKWSYVGGGSANLDADGIPVDSGGVPTGAPPTLADDTYLLPGANAGALIVQRGDGSYEPVGKARSIDVGSGEQLKFFINDVAGGFGSNPGSLNISYLANPATYGNANVDIQ